jgi:tRNA nucleotidyltransferase (CCA-adding enzyme)
VVLNRLQEKGFEAFLVGGCVRDTLLGLGIKDWDICTSALPTDILSCFADFQTIPTGIDHGTITVVIDRIPFEVTTYRVDGEYRDFRHPDGVHFTSSLSEDLARRDFTVNAMAYHPQVGLVDLYDGQKDLQDKQIRCVGEPQKRFGEDALRILRGLRFASVLGFAVEKNTEKAMEHQADLLEHIAKERIYHEITKLICGKSAGEIIKKYSRILKKVLPFWEYNETFVPMLSCLPSDPVLRYSVLYSGSDKVEQAMKILRAPNAVSQKVTVRSNLLGCGLPENLPQARMFVKEFGLSVYEDMLTLKTASGEETNSSKEFLDVITKNNLCCSLEQLAVSGKDLLALGVSPGKEMGQFLQTLLLAVIDEKVDNNHQSLLEYLEKEIIV